MNAVRTERSLGLEEVPVDAHRREIERLMARAGVDDLEELHRRFREGGYDRVDRPDHRISLKRLEVHVNAEAGVINPNFYRGLCEILGLSREEEQLYVLGVQDTMNRSEEFHGRGPRILSSGARQLARALVPH